MGAGASRKLQHRAGELQLQLEQEQKRANELQSKLQQQQAAAKETVRHTEAVAPDDAKADSIDATEALVPDDAQTDSIDATRCDIVEGIAGTQDSNHIRREAKQVSASVQAGGHVSQLGRKTALTREERYVVSFVEEAGVPTLMCQCLLENATDKLRSAVDKRDLAEVQSVLRETTVAEFVDMLGAVKTDGDLKLAIGERLGSRAAELKRKHEGRGLGGARARDVHTRI